MNGGKHRFSIGIWTIKTMPVKLDNRILAASRERDEVNGIDAMEKNSPGVPRAVPESAHAYEFLQSLYEILRSSLSTTIGTPMTTLERYRIVPTPMSGVGARRKNAAM